MSLIALVCLTLSIIIYVSYITYIEIKYKPDCISLSYYLLKKKNIFTIWILLVAGFTFPVWVEISPIYFQFLPFLSVIALALVGLYPGYLDYDRIPHITGAVITCILSLIWNIVSGTLVIPIVLVIVLLLLVTFNVKLLWIECLAFLNIYASIIQKCLL